MENSNNCRLSYIEQISIIELCLKKHLIKGTTLCLALSNANCELFPNSEKRNLSECIPLFTFQNAVNFGASNKNRPSWWSNDDIISRTKFLEWMLNVLRNYTTTTNP